MGATMLTDRQVAALDGIIEDAQAHGVEISDRHYLMVAPMPESRPGRGHDVHVSYTDGEHVLYVFVDVYGNHNGVAFGDVEWTCEPHAEAPCSTCGVEEK